MQTKVLGRTGIKVPIVSLGTVFIGLVSKEGESSRKVDEDVGAETVVAAIEAGCTLVDTAPIYGGTKSERIIGRVLRERPDLAEKCTVTTKVGRGSSGYDYSYDGVMKSVEESQERLGLDQFDILYIHDAMDVPREEVLSKDGALGALRQLQKAGVVRYIGTAAHDPESNGPYMETGEFDAAVVPDAWSLLNRSAEELIFPAAEKHNIGIALATPLERGLLATGPQPGQSYLNRNFGQEVLDHAGEIQALCESHRISILSASLQWCTRHPLVATTIPGGRNREEVVQNAEAGAIEIPEAFWAELDPLIRDWGREHIVKVGKSNQ